MGRNWCTDWRILQYVLFFSALVWVVALVIINASLSGSESLDPKVWAELAEAQAEHDHAVSEFNSIVKTETGDGWILAFGESNLTVEETAHIDAIFDREGQEAAQNRFDQIADARMDEIKYNYKTKPNLEPYKDAAHEDLSEWRLKERLVKGFTYTGLWGLGGLTLLLSEVADERTKNKGVKRAKKLGQTNRRTLEGLGWFLLLLAFGFSISGCVKGISYGWTIKVLPLIAYSVAGTLATMSLTFFVWDMIKFKNECTDEPVKTKQRRKMLTATQYPASATTATVRHLPVTRVLEAINANKAL